jgi:hypothetical protein
MRALIKAIVATAVLAAPLYANALPVTWNYSGVCTHGDCSVVPSITGTLTGDPTWLGNPLELRGGILFSELTSYHFSIGGYEFSGSDALGAYDLDASGNITGGSMTFGSLARLEFLDLGAATWHFSDSHCKFIIFCSTDVEASGRGSYNRATAIPEPATLSLLGLGLLGLGLARRRRAR